jgi:hypothetical protein
MLANAAFGMLSVPSYFCGAGFRLRDWKPYS